MNETPTIRQLLDAFNDLKKTLGANPTRDEFCATIKKSKYVIDQEYGSWTKFVAAAQTVSEQREYVPLSIVAPYIPEDDFSIEEIIEGMAKRFEKRKENHDAKMWMEFKVNTDEPIGICTFGDPHIDDDGCNWPLLLEHIKICKETPGMYGMNIGDTHNNWVGRLMKEYANQSTTRGTAFKLIEWFFLQSGINWLLILLGNHDTWNFGSEVMAQVTKNVCTMVDWRAKFKLKFSNDVEVLIDAAHDHSGHSQWNSLHGQQKASVMGGVAHLYIAGHKHNWALAHNECPHTGRVYWLARARGYKQIDHYGENLGFGSQKHGASIVTIIDPKADPLNRVKCFADPKEGAAYLTYLRQRK